MTVNPEANNPAILGKIAITAEQVTATSATCPHEVISFKVEIFPTIPRIRPTIKPTYIGSPRNPIFFLIASGLKLILSAPNFPSIKSKTKYSGTSPM